MNDNDLQKYQSQLEDLKLRLADEIGRMSDSLQGYAQAGGEHDRVVSETIEKELTLEGVEEDVQQQVVDALQRIRDGKYGKCSECGKVIAKARLNAIPYTAYCVRCEAEIEKQSQ